MLKWQQLDSNSQPFSLYRTLNHLALLLLLICELNLAVCYCHVTHAYQCESTLYSCLNVNELFAQNNCHVRSLTDINRIWTNNHLVRQRTLSHLTNFSEWFSCVVSAYLYGAFACMLLSCQVHVSEWTYTLYLPECQQSLRSKQGPYQKFNWNQQDLKQQPLIPETKTQPILSWRKPKPKTNFAEWLNCAVSTYLYGAFACMLS